MRQSLSEAQIGLKLLFSFQSARGHLCHLGCKRLQFKASPGYRTRFCLKKPTNQSTINKALLVLRLSCCLMNSCYIIFPLSFSTMRETMKYVYGHHGIRKGLYRGLSLNYIRCIPSQAVAFTTYEIMKQFFHLN